MPHKTFCKAVVVVAIAGAVGLSTIAQADVLVAVAGPMTGANAAYGDQYWRGYTYVWNDEQTDAELLEEKGAEKILKIKVDEIINVEKSAMK